MREYSIGVPFGLEPVIPTDLIERISRAGQEKRFVKNDTIYRQGESADHIYLLHSGRVKTVLVTPNGQEALLRIHLPRNILGLTALATNPVRDGNAVALEAIETSEIARGDLYALMRTEHDLAEHLIRLLVSRMTDFHYRVGEMLTQPVEQRLARALVALSQPDPASSNGSVRNDITLTHEELANLLNTRRPTISAAINRLSESGLVRRSGRRLSVSNLEGLVKLYQDPGGWNPA